ncbi:MAG: hypothetical protein ABI839_02815 [Verrucomicrobiota bacterium]
MNRYLWLRLSLCFPLLGAALAADAAITFPVSFSDPGSAHQAYYAALTANIQAAGADWAKYLAGSGSLEVQVEFTTAIARIDGASVTSSFLRNDGTRDIYEQGAEHELKSGVDPNGATPDIHIRINPDYLATMVWLDPHPSLRTDPIPPNHIDSMSLFIHELGHSFAFSGFINGTTGQLPATYMSTFDANVHFDGSNFYFVGPAAEARYGGPVPITYGNPGHLGNNSPRPGSNLLGDLMNGVVYNYQHRYDISALDLAIAQDASVLLLSGATLHNISTRLFVDTGDNALIAGFILNGSGNRTVLIRALGPTLSSFGVTGVLANPTIELRNSTGALLAFNDNWAQATNASSIPTTLRPPNANEAAIFVSLPPGRYTAIVRGAGNTTGVALAEVYDLGTGTSSILSNISTRGKVLTADKAMIGGFIIQGAGKRVVIRALGPTLTGFGVADALADPTLELRNANGGLISANDNWKASQQAAIAATPYAPPSDLEPAITAALPAGNYTAVVRGVNNTTGTALVEVYGLN